MITFSQVFDSILLKQHSNISLSNFLNEQAIAFDQIVLREQQFKQLLLVQRNTYEILSKLYIINKNKQQSYQLQKNLQKKIQQLNKYNCYSTYFYNIDKKIVDNETNKHQYNNCTVIIVQFQKVSLLDIIEDSLISKLNIAPIIKQDIYNNIEKFIRLNKKKLKQIDEQHKNFEYHNCLIEQIKKLINKSVFALYDNVIGYRINEIIKEHFPYYATYDIVDIPNIAKHGDKSVVEELANLYYQLNFSPDMKWLQKIPESDVKNQ